MMLIFVFLFYHPDLVTPEECLAMNIYHEARGEPVEGQIKVAIVTINRVKDKRWPDSVCEVVFQPKQFSWTNDIANSGMPIIREGNTYLKIKDLAKKILLNPDRFENHGSTHYVREDLHNRVYWTRKMEKVAEVGSHIFYR